MCKEIRMFFFNKKHIKCILKNIFFVKTVQYILPVGQTLPVRDP